MGALSRDFPTVRFGSGAATGIEWSREWVEARAITKTLKRRLSENLMELCKRNDGDGDDDRQVAMITNVDWNSYSGLREFYGV